MLSSKIPVPTSIVRHPHTHNNLQHPLYVRYSEVERSISTKMTLTRFIRFAKEFHLCFVGSGMCVS